jgi:hypothetical protein
VSSPRRRLTAVLIITTLLGLALVAWARAPGAVAGAPTGLRITAPLEPVDLVATLVATELRSSSDPRPTGGVPWMPALMVSLLAAVFLVSTLTGEAGRADRGRFGLGPHQRAPPAT